MATASQLVEPGGATLPSSSFPALVRNGTLFVPALAFDGAATETAYWILSMAQYGGGDIAVRLFWYADSSTSGNVLWEVALAAITANTDTQDVETKTVATATSGLDSHLGTNAQRLHYHDIVITGSSLDGLAQHDFAVLRVQRLGADATDTLNAIDALLTGAEVSFTAA